MKMKYIQNKIGSCCMWDGDPIYCGKCKRETSSTFTLPTGIGVCGSCAQKFKASPEYQPLPCSNCRVVPELLLSKGEGEGLLCSSCSEALYGAESPEDVFDAAFKPFGGRLKLPPPKPDAELTPNELADRQMVRGMFGNMSIPGVQPMSGPGGLIFYLQSKYDKNKQAPDEPLFDI